MRLPRSAVDTLGKVCVFLVTLASCASAAAQQPTGTISGVITDESGAVVHSASVTITDLATEFKVNLRTTRTGVFAIAALSAGEYELRAKAQGFAMSIVRLTVEVGRTTNIDVRLRVGGGSDTVTVRADDVRIATTETSVDGIITEKLIREFPLNGRNFLELGELQPGVQVTGGGVLYGVTGFNTGLGVAGQSGMTTRVTLDGLDITDDHFGAAAANISQDAIREFQVTRSAADISTGITGNGAVNIATRSGDNEFHGSTFLYFRDDTLAARIAPQYVPFDRKHYGFNAGGPFQRDRLFWFLSYERIQQNTGVATAGSAFPQFTGTWQIPYREHMAFSRADWLIASGVRVFGRFIYNGKKGIPVDENVGGSSLIPQSFVDFSNITAVGLDSSRGRFTHSIRFGFFNVNTRAVAGNALIPHFPTTLDPAGRPLAVFIGSALSLGTNGNTPKHRFQDNYEVRYDGGFSAGPHTLRWGGLVDIIRTNWFEALNSTPQVNTDFTIDLLQRCGSDPLCYPLRGGQVGNNLGWLSEVPTLGFPYGGFKNSRVHVYVGDGWRATSRLYVNWGLRWLYEPGQNTPGVIKPAFLDDFQPGLSKSDRTDLNNFAPQVGVAWRPTNSGKWAVRANAGVFYDTYLLRNNWWVRNNLSRAPIRNAFTNFANGLLDPNTGKTIFDLDGGDPSAAVTPGVNWLSGSQCKDPRLPAGNCALATPGLLDAIMQASALYQQASRQFSLSGTEQPSTCELRTANCQIMDPNYATPYTLQFSAGLQHELIPGLVLAVDWVHHRGQHYVLRTDMNRLGAADTLNMDNAIAAIIATNKSLGCPASASSAAIDCAISKKATIFSYGDKGLGGGGGGGSLSKRRAFGGVNPNFNRVIVYRMEGWSTYNALQVHLRGRLPTVRNHLKNWSIVTSYSLGRLVGTSQEENLVWLVEDDFKYMHGPTTLDRTHIFSLATGFDTVFGFRLNSFWRASSSVPQSVFLPIVRSNSPAEIFTTDLNGDGSNGDPLPGTNRGSYGRDIGCGGTAINRVIDAFNSGPAGRFTPAGQALINAGLFSNSQLNLLGATIPKVTRAPDGQVCLDSLFTTDVRLSRPIKLARERVVIEPTIEFFNVFNVSNFDLPYSKLRPVLDGLPGSLNGTTAANRTNRAGVAAGTMSTGAPRSWQLALRVSF